ncbi:hypothetical protein LTS08_000941 [Lithohypha guttulata]|nr:hypothetical protein LTS08_000941 [Lithohypha guttulata]
MAQPFKFITRSTRYTPLLSTNTPRLQQCSTTWHDQIRSLSATPNSHIASPYHRNIHINQRWFITSRASPSQSSIWSKVNARSTYSFQQRSFSWIHSLRKPAKQDAKEGTAPQVPVDPTESANNSSQAPASTPGTTTTTTTQATDTPNPVPKLLQRLTPVELHENIYTIPNILTATRILTAPIISYALLHSQPALAFTLFAYSSITDLVDGFLARRYNMGTVLGSILDPFADKLLMTLTTISLYAIGTFPWWLTLIILGRDGGLLLSALYFRWISLPHPRTMKRYWDFSLPSAEVRPTEISKINTLLQFLLVADAVLLPVLPVSFVEAWNLWGVFQGWMGLVAGTTIWSGLSYFFAKDAIRFIGQDQKKQK